MTERTVSIQQGIQDEIDNSIRVNAHGLDQAWKASAQARAESPAGVKVSLP